MTDDPLGSNNMRHVYIHHRIINNRYIDATVNVNSQQTHTELHIDDRPTAVLYTLTSFTIYDTKLTKNIPNIKDDCPTLFLSDKQFLLSTIYVIDMDSMSKCDIR